MAAKRARKAEAKLKAHDIFVTPIFHDSTALTHDHKHLNDVSAFRENVNKALTTSGSTTSDSQQFTIVAVPQADKIRQHCQQMLQSVPGAVVRVVDPDVAPTQTNVVIEVISDRLWLHWWAFRCLPERSEHFAKLKVSLMTVAQWRQALSATFGCTGFSDRLPTLVPTCVYFDDEDLKRINQFAPTLAASIPLMNISVVFGRAIGECAKGTVLRRSLNMQTAHRVLQCCTPVKSLNDITFVSSSDDLCDFLLNAPAGVSHNNLNPRTSVVITL